MIGYYIKLWLSTQFHALSLSLAAFKPLKIDSEILVGNVFGSIWDNCSITKSTFSNMFSRISSAISTE